MTLFDVYECAINPKLLEEKIQAGALRFGREYVSVEIDTFGDHSELDQHGFVLDKKEKRMRAPDSKVLRAYMHSQAIAYACESESGQGVEDRIRDVRKEQQFEAVKRWFYQDWARIEPKLRTSIVEGISVFLSLFDDNPDVKRVFCPPKSAYDPQFNKDARAETHAVVPMPPFADTIEQGKVVALNLPVSLNPGLARTIGTLVKLDFERAVLNRIPHIEKHRERHWREVLFLCDEYQAFATAGEFDPTGDEKFFALSRQAKCISIVATQSISSCPGKAGARCSKHSERRSFFP